MLRLVAAGRQTGREIAAPHRLQDGKELLRIVAGSCAGAALLGGGAGSGHGICSSDATSRGTAMRQEHRTGGLTGVMVEQLE